MDILNWLGFASAALVYAVTFILVLFSANKSFASSTVLLALFGGLIWSGVTFYSRIEITFDSYLFAVESIRLFTLICFIKATLKLNDSSFKNLFFSPVILFSFVVLALVPIANAYFWISKATVFLIYLGFTILALVYLEFLFKKAKAAIWGLKPMLVGIGTLLIFDFIIFADASVIRQVDQDMWLARGYLHTVFIPLMLISLKRTKELGINVFISREMVFQSSLLFAAGAYLTVMAIAAYYIKAIEAEWSNLVQIVFIILAFVALLILIVSDELKRRFKVFIQKHFFANQFDYRERWLGLTRTISKPLKEDESIYQRVLTGFCQSVSYDQGCLIKLSGNSHELIAKQNMVLTEQNVELLTNTLLPYIEQKSWLIDIQEYINSVQNYPGLVIPYSIANNLPFQAVIPIYDGETLWGVCLLATTKEKLSFNWEIRDYMSVVAMQLANVLLQNEANKIITENAQFAAFNRTSAFVVHDLKNVLAQIRLIVENSEKFKHNPEFIDDTFDTLRHTDARMQKMLDQLLSKQSLEHSKKLTSLAQILNHDVLPKTQSLMPKVILNVESDFSIALNSERMASVLFHLIDNAQQATDTNGEVSVSLKVEEQSGNISIKDNGIGMSEDFVANKLFRPFETTKGNAGMGIGAYDAKLYIESLGGTIVVQSELNKGSEFVISLPFLKE